jgi:hypothetical protein
MFFDYEAMGELREAGKKINCRQKITAYIQRALYYNYLLVL